MQQKSTIAAIATPPGTGAIAIIRISGSCAIPIADLIFSKSVSQMKSHTVRYGNILDIGGGVIDSVLLLVMRAPRSYTGEDSVEIFCHGGSLVTERVLQRVFDAGAVPAEPGEFSLRAFLNGKIDLAQAEAVQELIHARNEEALQNAEKQLEGVLSQKILSFQKQLTEIAAILEAWVDFPEEGLEFMSKEEMIERLEKIREKMRLLKDTFRDGKILREGLSLCLIGSPNVGKSSLMNVLLQKPRAIVTDIPGTTRDVLEEDLVMGNLHFTLIDTAGIRNSEEPIEKEGIRRSFDAAKNADLILLLLDASRKPLPEEKNLIDTLPKEKTLMIWNKADLALKKKKRLEISAKQQTGIETLKKAIEEKVWTYKAPSKEEVLITKMRHFQALQNAEKALTKVLEGLCSQISSEFVTADMRFCLKELASIIGFDVSESILSEIFRRFCLGK